MSDEWLLAHQRSHELALIRLTNQLSKLVEGTGSRVDGALICSEISRSALGVVHWSGKDSDGEAGGVT